jgi:probable F420-dependent oxidoreductase
MEFRKLGVWFSTDRLDAPGLRALASRVEALGYGSLWYPESQLWESLSLGAHLLNSSNTLLVGSSIANIYARDAVTARNGIRVLSAISGGRYILGLGVSHKPMVEGLRGHEYEKPIPAMRRYLEGIGSRDTPAEAAKLPVMIAALRPRMLQLAATHTRGALPYLVTPEHTEKARAILGKGKLVVEQKVCLNANASEAREYARAEVNRYQAMPNYRESWKSIGFTEDEITGQGSDRFIDAMVAWGDLPAIRRRIQEHLDAGADQVAIQPVHSQGKRNEVDWMVLEELAPGA